VRKLYLVRHADAGHRSDWPGKDVDRPLSPRGQRQADGLRDLLADNGPTRLLSSPFARCVQTLEPLANQLGLTVEPEPRLGEGAGTKALDLARELAGTDAVLCSHGDVIPDVLEGLIKDGIKLKDDLRWQKASTWVLSWDDGRLTKGRYLAPPA
jgi:8-oxo-dGTP diphosphatase